MGGGVCACGNPRACVSVYCEAWRGPRGFVNDPGMHAPTGQPGRRPRIAVNISTQGRRHPRPRPPLQGKGFAPRPRASRRRGPPRTRAP